MAEHGFTLTSRDFGHNQFIPLAHTCDGRDEPPVLEWTRAPTGTRSLVLIVDDPDARGGDFTHWVQFDIPGAESGAVEGAGISGRNDFHGQGWRGPCPPPNAGVHRYVFTLYALDRDRLGLEAGATREEVEEALRDHILDTATLVGRFERRTG